MRSQETKNDRKMLNKTELKDRGWTDGLIGQLLPAPIIEERQSRKYGNYTVHLWDETVVQSAEQTREWAKTQDRRRRAAETRQRICEVDLLSAIFTVNRAAKRQRDLAEHYYRQGMHGFAGFSRQSKERYYDLKDAGIIAAHKAARLSCLFSHGGLYLWRGEGYSFHSTLKPKALEVPGLELAAGQPYLFVEAKPKRANERRLQDAVRSLECLANAPGADSSQYERASTPKWKHGTASIICWNCGECGHMARECTEEDDDEY